jgi:hypothetical protein
LTYNYLTKKVNGGLVGTMIQDVDPRFQDQDYEEFWDSLNLGDYSNCEVPGSTLPGSSLPLRFVASKLNLQSNLLLISVAYPNPVQGPAPNGNNRH